MSGDVDVRKKFFFTPFPRCLHGDGTLIMDCTDDPMARTVCATSVEGECLKLAATDHHFKVNISTSGAPFHGRLGITSHIGFLLERKFEVNGICGDKICVFELSSRTDKITPLDLTPVILGLVLRGTGSASFESASSPLCCTPEAVAKGVSSFLFGLKNNEHDSALKIHFSRLTIMCIAGAPDGAPVFVKMRQVHQT